ncbi:hypothetical protein E4T42_07190 [Aureobasidium subglaciale]|nr:hypothetical protein E4T42_07190 [Aureobasidium subglaciale]
MHMILALSNAHLRRLANRTESSANHALLEAVHWQRGLQNYRTAVSLADPTASQEYGDALVTGSLLSLYYSTTLDGEMAPDAFIVDYEAAVETMLAPLALSHGLRALRMTLGTFTPSSIFASVWALAAPKGSMPIREPKTPDSLFILEMICNLNIGDDMVQEMVRSIADRLAPIMFSSGTAYYRDDILRFGGKAWPHLCQLLAGRSPQAMMLLFCWFKVLGGTRQWWASTRAKSQAEAIKVYLCSLPPPIEDLSAWSFCLVTVFAFESTDLMSTADASNRLTDSR